MLKGDFDTMKKALFLIFISFFVLASFSSCETFSERKESASTINSYAQNKQETDAASSVFSATFTASDNRIGDARVLLKTGFDFVKSDSSQYNEDLELIAATLSSQIYTNANGTHADDILYGLGYDSVMMPQGEVAAYERPVSCFAYKRLSDGSNVFTVVVRGTDSATGIEDILTDIGDSFSTMFEDSAEAVRDELEQYMLMITRKTSSELKKEKNYFFFTGHSLGGAVANCLSVDNVIKEYASGDKGRIYTYTFESPHTCVNLWWTDPESESNALNFKVNGDTVTNFPPYIGSTTYGKDEWIQVSELDDSVFNQLFRNALFSKIDGNVGYHDTCLGLIYIIGNVMQDKSVIGSEEEINETDIQSQDLEEHSSYDPEETSEKIEDKTYNLTEYSWDRSYSGGYTCKNVLKIGQWVKASDTEAVNEAWRSVGGKNELPSITTYKPNRYATYSGDFKERTSVYVFGTISVYDTTEGGFSIGDSSNAVIVTVGSNIKQYTYDYDGLVEYSSGFTYTHNNESYVTNMVRVSPKMDRKSWGPVPFAVCVSRAFSPEYPDGNPDVIDSTWFFGDNEFTISPWW